MVPGALTLIETLLQLDHGFVLHEPRGNAAEHLYPILVARNPLTPSPLSFTLAQCS